MIYLDHAATTPLDERVLEEMMPYMTCEFGNPGSIHACGRAAREAVDKARDRVAAFFSCKPEQVIFTSGGSEGNNMVFAGIENELQRRGRTRLVTTATEHDSVRKSARKLSIKPGFCMQVVLPRPYRESAERFPTKYEENTHYGWYGEPDLKPYLTPETGLCSVMYVNNETGLVNDVSAIGKLCREHNILFHVDAVQAAGIIPLNVSDVSADFMTVSSHKINGPKGVGGLFVRDRSVLTPMISGGADQEFGLRGGTENVAGIVGFGKACELASAELTRHLRYLTTQQSQMIYMLKSKAAEYGMKLRVNGDICNISPKTMSICIPGVDAETLLLFLDARGVCVSAGSACRAHESSPSHVLTAMGFSDDDARSSIRISISHLNTSRELNEAADLIISCAAKLKGLSK